MIRHINRFLILFLIISLFSSNLFAVDFGYDKIDFFGKEKEESPRITIKKIKKKRCYSNQVSAREEESIYNTIWYYGNEGIRFHIEKT